MPIRNLIFVLILLSAGASAQTLTMLSEATSKMPSGTSFQARDESGHLYRGHLVCRRAGRLLRRGSMTLVFDDPLHVVNSDPEGIIRPRLSKKRLALQLGGSALAGKVVDDSIDRAVAPGKARYIGLAVTVVAIFWQRGSDAKLQPGDTVDVEPGR
jgi:hypothetical protein